MIDSQIVNYVFNHEGYRGSLYCDKCGCSYLRGNRGLECSCEDGTGEPTIGYGTNVNALTRKVLEEVATNTIGRNLGVFFTNRPDVSALWTKLTMNRRKVLADMCYQLGPSGLAGFERMLDYMVGGNYTNAADEIQESEYAKQVPWRAADNARLMSEG